MRQDRACPSDKCSTLLIQPLLLDNLLMCSTTRVLEDQAPKLRFVASLAQLLNFWCVFLISVTSHQNSFLLAIPVPFYSWDCRPQIIGFWLLYYFFSLHYCCSQWGGSLELWRLCRVLRLDWMIYLRVFTFPMTL